MHGKGQNKDTIKLEAMKKSMKYSLKFILFILIISVFAFSSISCENENEGDGTEPSFSMKARLVANSEKLEVDVIEAEYASGIFHVITSEETEFYKSNGEKIKKSDLVEGDVIIIEYSGQMMMSYPPQIVALKIRVD